MSTDVPVTTWQPTSGNGEMGTDGLVGLKTISGLGLTTLSGVGLETLQSTFTQIPTTLWVEDDSQ